MKNIIALAIASSIVITLPAQEPLKEDSKQIEFTLSAAKNKYKVGETIHIRVELKNLGNRPILIGRELSPIANWPFSVSIKLVDGNGKYVKSVRVAYVDPPPRPDLSARGGVLRWWTVLDPGCFYGKEVDLQLGSIEPGTYELQANYYSVGLSDKKGSDPKPNARDGEIPVFSGKIEAMPFTVEIVKQK